MSPSPAQLWGSLPALMAGGDTLNPPEMHSVPHDNFCRPISLLWSLVLVKELGAGSFGDPIPLLPGFTGSSAHSLHISGPHCWQCDSSDGTVR